LTAGPAHSIPGRRWRDKGDIHISQSKISDIPTGYERFEEQKATQNKMKGAMKNRDWSLSELSK